MANLLHQFVRQEGLIVGLQMPDGTYEVPPGRVWPYASRLLRSREPNKQRDPSGTLPTRSDTEIYVWIFPDSKPGTCYTAQPLAIGDIEDNLQ